MVQQDSKDSLKDKTIRVLLVGDPGVGKTSLIHSLVNDEFDASLPPRMANITIPAQVTPENIPIDILDYSAREQSQEDLRSLIREANVICIVYDASDSDSLSRVRSHWVQFIRKSQPSNIEEQEYKPIILVANKYDLIDEESSLVDVNAVVQEFVEIEAFIEVSALTQKNVVELFSSAQKAITYPLAPLFDPQRRILTKKCRDALIKIFRLSDYDEDGLLDDHELNLFQENCFGLPLQRDALDDLKMIIKQSTIDGILNDSMTQAGFLFLHALSIDKGRHDFTWQVLRKFNYDNQVNNTDDIEDGNSDAYSQENSLTSSHEDESYLWSHSDASENESQTIHDQLGLNWMREHPSLVKAGACLTLATLLSMLAIKYLVQTSSRG